MAVNCLIKMFCFITIWANLCILCHRILGGLTVFGTYDAGGHRDNPVTHDHNKRGDEPSKRGYWGDIPKSHRGECYDAPVDAKRDIIKAAVITFYQVH